MELFKELNDDYICKNNIKQLKDNEYTDIYLLKYDKDKTNLKIPLNRKLRGIIFEKETNNIICYSLDKFDNKDNLDLTNICEWKIEEAIDGTQIRLYYYNSKWISTTARRIDSKKSKWNYVKTFYELFKDVEHLIDYSKLNKDYTYTFILKHIENRIISNISKNELIHIHTRDNKSLEEKDIDIGITKPSKLNFDSYNEFKNYLETLTFETKGCVVKVENKRYMFNSPDYEKVKELKGNHLNINYNYITLIQNNKLDEFLNYFPEYRLKFNTSDKDIRDLISNIHYLYIEKNVNKTITLKEINVKYRKILYDLHGEYISNKEIITYEKVKDFIYNLPVGYIVKLLKK